jgi:hypothetical protein
MFKGEYHGKSCHTPDLGVVLQRAWAAGALRHNFLVTTAGGIVSSHPWSQFSANNHVWVNGRCSDHELACAGVQRIIITATNLKEAREALKLACTDGAVPQDDVVRYQPTCKVHSKPVPARAGTALAWRLVMLIPWCPHPRAAVLHGGRAPDALLRV